MTTRTYQNVTLEQAQGLLDTAKQYGSVVNGDMKTGTISDYGCTIQYNYDQPAQSLKLTVTQKPFFVSGDTVLNQIESHSTL